MMGLLRDYPWADTPINKAVDPEGTASVIEGMPVVFAEQEKAAEEKVKADAAALERLLEILEWVLSFVYAYFLIQVPAMIKDVL